MSPRKRGVSPIISVVLLVGITVALTTGAAFFVFNIGSQTTSSQPIAGVSLDGAEGSNVSLKVVSMDNAESITVKTSAGEKTVSSLGTYRIDSYGNDISIIATDSRGSQSVLTTYSPDVNSSETSDILLVESESTVSSQQATSEPLLLGIRPTLIAETQTTSVDTIEEALSVAEAGDVIKLESGVHTDANTVNVNINKSVVFTAEENSILSCKNAPIDLALNKAKMTEQSQLPATKSCSTSSVTYPTPSPNGGFTVLGGAKTTSTQTSSDSTTEDKNATTPSNTNITVRVSGFSDYDLFVIETAGSQRVVNSSGVYTVESFGQPVDVYAAETQDTITGPSKTRELLRTIEPTTETGEIETNDSSVLVVEADDSASSVSDSVTTYSTLADAVSDANTGDLISIESGVHTAAGTVDVSVSKDVTLLFEQNATLSCADNNVDFQMGSSATFNERSSYPSIVCSSLDSGYSATVDSAVKQAIINKVDEDFDGNLTEGDVFWTLDTSKTVKKIDGEIYANRDYPDAVGISMDTNNYNGAIYAQASASGTEYSSSVSGTDTYCSCYENDVYVDFTWYASNNTMQVYEHSRGKSTESFTVDKPRKIYADYVDSSGYNGYVRVEATYEA